MQESGPVYYDIHLHLAGCGCGGTGCWLNPKRKNSFAFSMIRRLNHISKTELDNMLEESLWGRIAGWLAEMPYYRVVALALDWARENDGELNKSLTDIYVPNDYVIRLAENNPQVLAGVSIHPYRKDALDELRRCAEHGAALVKWLPVSQNIDPSDPRSVEFCKLLAEYKLPLLCHTGSEGATRNINKEFNNPLVLKTALEQGGTVIAAHCGMRSLPIDKDYFDVWKGMLGDYPHLWGDTAAWFGFRARKAARELKVGGFTDRLIYGSDWPVPSSPWWLLGHLPVREIRKLAEIKNPFMRDVETKKAMGLPEEVFTRAAQILRPS
ncbi:MAG: amidohydrolase family protein [Planctomycetes bacterium]|nr:amidohydrolase family protein [Planctomycetota bacterium]